FTLTFGPISDRLNLRGPIMLPWTLISLIGYIVSITQTRPGVAYFGAVLSTGIFVTIPPLLAWTANNDAGDFKRAIVLAMTIGSGNLGGYVLTPVFLLLFGRLTAAPGYAPHSYL